MLIIGRVRDILGTKTQDRESSFLLNALTTSAHDHADPNGAVSTNSDQSRKYTEGWRSTVSLHIVLGFSILILNLGLVIWCYAKKPIENGIAIIYEGPCTKTKVITTALHLAVCALSALLLGASNYCMQILSAPTRQDIDAAHARRKWLSIGVSSLKNLLYVDRKKALFFLLLGISSIPLHLLWNSAFVSSLSANNYIYNAVTEPCLEGAPWNTSKTFLSYNQFTSEAQAMLDHYRNNSLIRLETTECINAYNVAFLTEYSNLLLVYGQATSNDSLILQARNSASPHSHGSFCFDKSRQGEWMCGLEMDCSLDRLAQNNASHWNPFYQCDPELYINGAPRVSKIQGSIQYCLAEQPKRPCTVGISTPILVTVMICNAAKIVCFISTLWVGRSMYPLLTNGDAVQSFLRHPDTSFNNRCLATKADVKHNKRFWSARSLPLIWQG